MANWKKIKKTIEIGIGVLGVVGIVAGFILSIMRPGRMIPRPRSGPSGGGGGVWFVGTGQTKKPGSWSSGRHK